MTTFSVQRAPRPLPAVDVKLALAVGQLEPAHLRSRPLSRPKKWGNISRTFFLTPEPKYASLCGLSEENASKQARQRISKSTQGTEKIGR